MRPIEFHILLTLAAGEGHGYAIIQNIQIHPEAPMPVEAGTLYRALQRLVEQELVRFGSTGVLRFWCRRRWSFWCWPRRGFRLGPSHM